MLLGSRVDIREATDCSEHKKIQGTWEDERQEEWGLDKEQRS